MEDKMEVQRISELVEAQSIFISRGISRIKVTKGDKVVIIEIPIKSTGLEEYRQGLRGDAPKPPTKITFIKKGSKEAEKFGIDADSRIVEYDFTDPEYVEKNEKYMQEFAWKLAVFAIDCPLIMANGKKADTYEEKKSVLASNGLTGYHLDRMAVDIRNLTIFTSEQEDFLSGS